MGILGDVNDGWFAKLANGVEGAGRWVGNNVFGGSAGDNFYNNMGRQADGVVNNINQNAINQAAANGANPQQALQAGSNAMDKLVNPSTPSDFVQLGGAGAQTATNTVVDTVQQALTPDLSGLIMGALAIGGTLVACEMCSKPAPTPTVRRERHAAMAA